MLQNNLPRDQAEELSEESFQSKTDKALTFARIIILLGGTTLQCLFQVAKRGLLAASLLSLVLWVQRMPKPTTPGDTRLFLFLDDKADPELKHCITNTSLSTNAPSLFPCTQVTGRM